ncbi:cysteine dioxygenase [Streptomyces litchfieldiae]|uniref:Cysteine dioxygenase family protein n=1 Tax=Streptomyces litchfieldiae TaxID=3075543 RepID=A0ABU2MRJ8_9ACTN|nr:cysteine dioxygenase family protein [Streptomyces sp. DSM 44938]MDT0344101.1 cysteine dioxygenase family protein [Streptomyces sp. DSM 44938]
MSLPTPVVLSPGELADTVRRFAARPALWRPLVRFTSPGRHYRRLEVTADHEVWLLTWLPGQGTEIHDHGGSAGSFGVVEGALTERAFHAPAPAPRLLGTGAVRAFGPRHIHQVTNRGARPAVSIHAYAPALTTQSYYAQDADGGLTLVRTDAVTE